MTISDGFIGSVGNTPMIRLQRLSEETGCEVLGKAEFMNPGGSVKDRAAAAIIADAERRGELRAGGTVVEGTAGNTGIGLAHVCNARGYRCVIVMPDNQSPEKYRLLEMLGAEVHKVPVVPYSNPNQYQKVAQRLAASLANAVWSNQFDNTANRATHAATTGPEIWAQTGGSVDAFVAATGTGSITEGIGIGRITANLKDAPIDGAVHVPDSETVRCVYRLLHDEGLFLGSTSGVNVAGALQVARQLGPGHTIVTVLCDGGAKYQSRLFDRAWLAEKGLEACAQAPAAGPPVNLSQTLVA